jgi:hypothetical protein
MNITGFPTLTGSNWATVNLVEKNLTGNRPWVVSIKSTCTADYAGLMAGVKVEGIPFDQTGGIDT